MPATANYIFDNGIHRLGTTEPTLKENSLFYDGEYFKVGEGWAAITEDKVSDDDARLRTMAAVAMELIPPSALRAVDAHVVNCCYFPEDKSFLNMTLETGWMNLHDRNAYKIKNALVKMDLVRRYEELFGRFSSGRTPSSERLVYVEREEVMSIIRDLGYAPMRFFYSVRIG